nr:C-terminal binding protein [Thalassoroseus pseudoceratinae]
MAKFHVILTDRAWPDADVERKILGEIDAELIETDGPQDALKEAANADAIGTCWAPIGKDIVDATQKCRVISRFGIGLDNIDVATATARNILVTNVPDYCVDEVSDHALAMLLTCVRKIAFYDQRIHNGEYRLQAGPPLRRLRGQTLGLVGFGNTARALREKALALGLHVIAFTPSGNDHGSGCEMVALEDLLQRSDYVSLHAPYKSETEHLMNADTFAQMKSSAYLINTSRGGLVDQDALATALEDEKLAGAALDVFTPEPPDLQHPIFHDERVIATPHAAFLSEESLQELRTRAARQIVAVLSGERPENIINPEVWTDKN